MNNDNTFLALDLAGAVHSIALCETDDRPNLDSPGWLVRSRILRMHSWLSAGADRADEAGEWSATGEQIIAVAERWGLCLDSLVTVLLTHAGQNRAVAGLAALGGTSVCLPSTTYVISPRGLAPAVEVKDYAHTFDPPRVADLRVARDVFATLTEQAADDVQSDGLEQDDSFLDRYAQISVGGHGQTVVPMETLTDPAWLLETWRRSLVDLWGERASADADAIEIVALRLRCAVETTETFRPVLPDSDGRIERALVDPKSLESAADRLSGSEHLDPGCCYQRAKLLAGDGGSGPVVIIDRGSYICIPDGWNWLVNGMGHLLCRSISR